MSGKAKLSGPLLVLLVKASKNQGPILPSTVEPVLASSAESPGLGRDSPVPVRLAVAAAAQPLLPSHARLFLGTQTPQSCQGEAFQSGKKKIFPQRMFLKLKKKKKKKARRGQWDVSLLSIIQSRTWCFERPRRTDQSISLAEGIPGGPEGTQMWGAT